MSTYLTLQGKTLEELPQIPTNLEVTGGVGKAALTWQNNNVTVTGTTNIIQVWDDSLLSWVDNNEVVASGTTGDATGLTEIKEYKVRVAVYDSNTFRYYPSLVKEATTIEQFTIASGGIESTVGDYKIHKFISGGTFTITQVGAGALDSIEYLIVAGGGGGGSSYNTTRNGGGGGGGGMLEGYVTGNTVGAKTITVGAGGGGATTFNVRGNNGGNSSALGLTATGGGGGGSAEVNITGADGGSGGGAGGDASAGNAGGSGTVGQGNAGASNTGSGGAGGGGKSGVGTAGGTGTGSYGSGGAGKSSSITGVAVTYAAGGNGSKYNQVSTGAAGAANTGNGGGGSNNGNYSGSNVGGSGIVVLKYKFQ